MSAYRVACLQCSYSERAVNVTEAKYKRNKHIREATHFEVDYERIA